jgi:hypothetical protein
MLKHRRFNPAKAENYFGRLTIELLARDFQRLVGLVTEHFRFTCRPCPGMCCSASSPTSSAPLSSTRLGFAWSSLTEKPWQAKALLALGEAFRRPGQRRPCACGLRAARLRLPQQRFPGPHGDEFAWVKPEWCRQAIADALHCELALVPFTTGHASVTRPTLKHPVTASE